LLPESTSYNEPMWAHGNDPYVVEPPFPGSASTETTSGDARLVPPT
jgi:hypothetical protein